jgi:hypothetical protein
MIAEEDQHFLDQSAIERVISIQHEDKLKGAHSAP